MFDLTNILLANLIFFILFFSGTLLINKFENKLGIEFFLLSPFVGILSLITFSSLFAFIQILINIKLIYIYIFYFFLLIFFFKKSFFNKEILLIFVVNLLILNTLSFVTITFDSLNYKSLAFNFDFLIENKLIYSMTYANSMTSFIYLINFVSQFSKNLIINFYPVLAFNALFLVFHHIVKTYKFNFRENLYIILLLLVIFFSRNYSQHVFYFNSHLLTSICIFVLVGFNKKISNNSKVFLIVSIIFLRIDNFIYILILFAMNYFNLIRLNLSNNNNLIIYFVIVSKLLLTNFFLENQIQILNSKIIYLTIFLFSFQIILTYFFKLKKTTNIEKLLRYILFIVFAFILIHALIEPQDKIEIYFYNILFDNFSWGITWYLFFTYLIYILIKNISLSSGFYFIIFTTIIYLIFINFGNFNVRIGFGDASNRLMFHLYFLLIYEFSIIFSNFLKKTNLN